MLRVSLEMVPMGMKQTKESVKVSEMANLKSKNSNFGTPTIQQ